MQRVQLSDGVHDHSFDITEVNASDGGVDVPSRSSAITGLTSSRSVEQPTIHTW